MELYLAERTVPLTCWQHCACWYLLQNFAVLGTAGVELARYDRDVCKVLFENPSLSLPQPELTDETVAKTLADSWTFEMPMATSDLTSQARKEKKELQWVRDEEWCVSAFEVGLFQNREYPWIAVSPDGIAKVRFPESSELVVAGVEMKSRLAPVEELIASQIANTFGRYFHCQIGDQIWFEVVISKHRCQLIHQASVLDVNYIVYIIVDDSRVIFSCLVHFPKEIRTKYLESIKKWAHLVDWAYLSLNVSSPPPQVPAVFGPSSQKTLSSHLRLWSAFRKKVMTAGVLPPVRIFKSWVQVLHNSMKGNFDKNSLSTSTLYNSRIPPVGVEQSIVLHSLKHMIINSYALFRLGVMLSDPSKTWKTQPELLRHLNNVQSLNDFVYDLFNEQLTRICSSNSSVPPNKAHICTISPISLSAEELSARIAKEAPTHHRKVYHYFNDGLGKQARLSSVLNHRKIEIGKSKSGNVISGVCVVCGKKGASISCSICGIKTHHGINSGLVQGQSCWDHFHSIDQLRLEDRQMKTVELKSSDRRLKRNRVQGPKKSAERNIANHESEEDA